MTSSVPSVKDITNTFPKPITKIMGEPNYESLKNLKDQLKANAASIPTTLGGGNHGYLGLILSPAAYATIAANQFIEPIYPGQHPNVPAGTNAANTSTIVRRHTEDLCQWREFKNVNTALKNQLLSALDDIYVCALKDRHVGYMNQSIRTILAHLLNNYGNITPLEFEDNNTKMRATWDPNSPFDCLTNQIEDGQDYADDGSQPYTAKQLLRITYTLVFKTGLYFKDCKVWNARPTAARTWDNFKTHFQNAQRLLCDQMRTTKQAGFHSHLAHHQPLSATQPPQRNIRKPSLTWHPPPPLIANSSPCSQLLLQPLTNTSTNSTQAPQTHHPLSKPTPTQPPPQQPCPLSPPPSPNYNNNSQHSKKKMCLSATVAHDDPNPVATMGITAGRMVIVSETNTPVKHAKTKPGHQDRATRDNTMSSSQANKPNDL